MFSSERKLRSLKQIRSVDFLNLGGKENRENEVLLLASQQTLRIGGETPLSLSISFALHVETL
jgi:hypothetical protein